MERRGDERARACHGYRATVTVKPRYPVYVISKGRPGVHGRTARFLIQDRCHFYLVVEPQELDAYEQSFGDSEFCHIRVLPFSNLGEGSIPARNWCWEDALAQGHDRHWILDDNINCIYRRHRAYRIRCNANGAFAACEDFIDRYENLTVAGMNYGMFAPDRQKIPPFVPNVHVYSCLCIDNHAPERWRGRYNEDTDLCLQVLAAGRCTALINAFLVDKVGTMTMKGGNSTELYKGDGRLKMARSLERVWPGVVTVGRRFKRPQHVVNWKKFDTPLKLREEVDLSKIKKKDYGMRLKEVAPIKSELVKRFIEEERG